ncbi:MAG: tetratricopeptide repeat protein [Actinomycetota bacterium]|nr:tetratricopeptide repeat protein [Actinomycetota bacterium]
MRRLRLPIAATAAVALLLGVIVGAIVYQQGKRDMDPGSLSVAPAGVVGGGALGVAIVRAQQRLREAPKDYRTWAELGAAYVQQGRITGDPSYYPKSEGALKRSLALNHADNWEALTGMGALANARHDFTAALAWGHKAQAVNAYSTSVYGVLNDALTQLGDYPAARAALQKMLDLHPGIPAYTRASYDFEERGLVDQAMAALQRALGEASDPADVAFCRYYLGELAFNGGNLDAAATQYRLGLQADPAYDPLLAGRAKAEAARGDTPAAVRDYATVTGRVPQPQYLLEYGELLQSLGRTAEAAQQYRLLGIEQQLFKANGVIDDLTSALFEADHGSPAAAVQHGRAEWGRRHSVLVADALGWALHRAGRDAEALSYAQQANRLGWRNAVFRYHLAMIELGLGRRDAARRDLAQAVHFNPYFSPLQAPVARKSLVSLGGTP